MNIDMKRHTPITPIACASAVVVALSYSSSRLAMKSSKSSAWLASAFAPLFPAGVAAAVAAVGVSSLSSSQSSNASESRESFCGSASAGS